MPIFLLRIAKWLVGKGVVFAIVGVLAILAFAIWLFATKSYRDEGTRVSALSLAREQAAQVYAKLESTHGRLAELSEELETTRARIESANQKIQFLDGILGRIERFLTMTPSERAAEERELEETRAHAAADREREKSLVEEQSDLRLDRVRLTEQAKEHEAEIDQLEAMSSGFVAVIDESWSTLKPYLLVAIVSVIAVPILWKLFAFFIWAPLLSWAGPIRLNRNPVPQPSLSHSGVSARIVLEKGQRVWVKESYLQASDECLSRRTRFVLNWSIPATCLAAGLVEMVEFSSLDETGEVTVSPQKQAEYEVAVIEIPEDGQMVIRPSSIAGVVARGSDPLRITRRWRLFHPQAWLTLQFRYFVFHGPCAIIASGVRGIRFEILDTSEGRGRRTNQIATIGFTPSLAYGVVRAETFWGYFRGFNPLFDDVFRGKGVFLCEEIPEKDATVASQFWSGVWNGLLKILGV